MVTHFTIVYMKKINWNAKNVVNLNEYPYDNIFGECGTAGDGIDIVFGVSVEKIPDYLFNSATISSLPKIKSVTILENVPEIEVNAFSDCPISVTLYTGTESEWKEAYIGIGNDTLTENVIFNAKKKTYHFVTNCENSIPDITDYLVSVSPNVTNIGKRILGWYDNESLSGTPIVFPYYRDKTTIYAAWADRTGTSFDDAFEAFANQQYTVTTIEKKQVIYFEFTPKITGEYIFYSKGSFDTYGYLYDSHEQQIISNDNGGEQNNFMIVRNLAAGKKYYIAVKSFNAIGTFTFAVETDCPVDTKTVCVMTANEDTLTAEIPNNLPQNAQVILACYKNGKLIETAASPNKNDTIYFIVSKDFDSAKVMVWNNLNDMKPACEAEIVK